MFLTARRFKACLSEPPRIRWAGVGHHGRVERTARYSVLGFWCVHIYRYRGRLRVNDEWFDIRPNRASVVPPDADLEYRWEGPSTHSVLHFWLADAKHGETAAALPAMQDLGADAAAVSAALDQAIVWNATQPERAVARLWDVLWRLATPSYVDSGPPPGARHPSVQRAMEWIELNLGEPLVVPELAGSLGLSHNHLTRLFRRDLGTTVVGYLRRRRAERARHLLADTTLPAKAIAAQVGLPDLHLFNKTLRREFGLSPRRIREEAADRLSQTPK